MSILIIGGAGFIGRTLQERLCESGKKIILLDKKKPFSVYSEPVIYINADVCDQENMLSVFEKHQIDGVIHLAAVSRVVEAENNPQECKRTNIGGIHSLLNSIEPSEQKPWLIFGSSREVYGEAVTLPVKESAPKKEVNIYGKTKIEGESLFLKFSKHHRLNCAIIRFSNVYGNRYDIFDRVIPRFIRAIVTKKTLTIEGGDQLIDFTHIDDTVEGVLRVIDYLNSKDNIQESFHICPGVGWSLYQLIGFIEKATGMNAKIKINSKRDYDVVKFVGDTSKINKLLGLQDFISLEEGINKCINEYCHDFKIETSV
ncbi:NAD-dependent epimerase/dehydratase family protein [Desulfobacterota bacterium M19]